MNPFFKRRVTESPALSESTKDLIVTPMPLGTGELERASSLQVPQGVSDQCSVGN